MSLEIEGFQFVLTQVVLQVHKFVNNKTWCANFAKISSIAKWLCLGHHSFVIS